MGQDYLSSLNITIKNEGNFAEVFTINIYANQTPTSTQLLYLLANTSVTLIVTWNTTGLPRGAFIMKTFVQPTEGETHTIDNTLTSNIVLVGVPCDVTGPTSGMPDGICNMRDIGFFCNFFGAKPGDPRWEQVECRNCDVTGPTTRTPDNTVNMRDIGEVCSNFGKT